MVRRRLICLDGSNLTQGSRLELLDLRSELGGVSRNFREGEVLPPANIHKQILELNPVAHSPEPPPFQVGIVGAESLQHAVVRFAHDKAVIRCETIQQGSDFRTFAQSVKCYQMTLQLGQ